jgi:hypothetical protein
VDLLGQIGPAEAQPALPGCIFKKFHVSKNLVDGVFMLINRSIRMLKIGYSYITLSPPKDA